MTGLFTGLIYICILLAASISRQRRGLVLVIPFLFFILAFSVNLLAPGNAIRQADSSAVNMGVFPAIYRSFCEALAAVQSWFTLPYICLLALMVPVLYAIAAKTSFRFPCPLLVFGFSFCLLSASFCPPVYSINYRPGRLMDALFYIFVFLSVGDLFYLLGWLHHRFFTPDKDTAIQAKTPGYSAASVMVTAALLLVGILLTGPLHCTSSNALYCLCNGDASAYHETFERRLDILLDDTQPVAVLPAYPAKPYVLFFDDITGDPTNWRNTGLQLYYNKDIVILREE